MVSEKAGNFCYPDGWQTSNETGSLEFRFVGPDLMLGGIQGEFDDDSTWSSTIIGSASSVPQSM